MRPDTTTQSEALSEALSEAQTRPDDLLGWGPVTAPPSRGGLTASPGTIPATNGAPPKGLTHQNHQSATITLGIDQSLTATGIATITNGRIKTRTIATTGKTNDSVAAQAARITAITAAIADEYPAGITLALIETPALSRNNTGTSRINGLYWAIISSLTNNNIPVATITTTQLKKYATGSGRLPSGKAGKQYVIDACVNRYNLTRPITTDEADALTLAAIGARHLGHPAEHTTPPPECLTVLDTITWPTNPTPTTPPTSRAAAEARIRAHTTRANP